MLSCPWASYNTSQQLWGRTLWRSGVRSKRKRNGEFNWLTGGSVGELQTPQNNVTLSSDVIFWAAPSLNTKVTFSPPGLVLFTHATTQAEILLSFHNVSETLKFHYHLFDVALAHRSVFVWSGICNCTVRMLNILHSSVIVWQHHVIVHFVFLNHCVNVAGILTT